MAKTLKYAHVVKHLPKFLGDDPDRQTLLNLVKDEVLAAPDEIAPEDYNLDAQIFRAASETEVLAQKMLALVKRSCVGPKDAAGLAKAYSVSRIVLDAINEWSSSAQLLVDAFERLMVDQMEVEGVTSMRLTSGANVSTYDEPYGKVVDKEAFRLWCVAPADKCMDCGEGADALWHSDAPSEEDPQVHHYHPGGGYERQLQLWPSTMNSLVKERALAADRQPDGVEVFAKTIVRLSKG